MRCALEQHVIDAPTITNDAKDYTRVSSKGRHFEHSLWYTVNILTVFYGRPM